MLTDIYTCGLAGYAKSEVVGRNCRFLQGKDSDPAVVNDLRGATTAATAHPCVVELINYRKDGSKFWNQARANCMPHKACLL